MTRRYRAHGLTIASDIELPMPSPPSVGQPDLVVRRGVGRVVPADEPPGSVMARMNKADGSLFYSFARNGEGTILRYPGLCDFVGGLQFTDVTAHLHSGVDPGFIPVLVAGAVVAVHLKLRGELVLHASAVRVDGQVIAFVGASGMGKSTLAAMLCANGAELVTDDVLRVTVTDGGTPQAFPGSIETRLREGARELADDSVWARVRGTADGRLAVRARGELTEPLPLAACVIPLRSRAVEQVSARRHTAVQALMRMVQFPRVYGWTEPVTTAQEFQALGDLVERVPVFEATVPWGPPFDPRVGPALLSGVLTDAGHP